MHTLACILTTFLATNKLANSFISGFHTIKSKIEFLKQSVL